MNFSGAPSIISIAGLEPWQRSGITKGIGLSFIITINSSLNYLASSGIAQTLISFTCYGDYISILSKEAVKIFFLKLGSLSIILLKKANYKFAG